MIDGDYWWSKLEVALSTRFANGEITEEEMDNILDQAVILEARHLKAFCLKQGVGKKGEDCEA